MTTQAPVLCLACTHLFGDTADVATCAAYPTEIPEDIREGGDHRTPRGDEVDGLTFEKASEPSADVALQAWLDIRRPT